MAKRGRKAVNNSAVLAEILKNEVTRKAFKTKVDTLVESKKSMMYDQEAFAEDVGSVAETTKLSKGFINKIVTAIAKNNEALVKEESEGVAEVLEVIFNITDNE